MTIVNGTSNRSHNDRIISAPILRRPFQGLFQISCADLLPYPFYHFTKQLGNCSDKGHPWDHNTWGFPKIKGTLLGGPYKRITIFWGLYLSPLVLGNYHMGTTGQLQLFPGDSRLRGFVVFQPLFYVWCPRYEHTILLGSSKKEVMLSAPGWSRVYPFD